MRRVIVCGLLALCAASGQSALERQRASASKQLDSLRRRAGVSAQSFFSTAWLGAPVRMIPANAPDVRADCEPVSAASLSGFIAEAATREGLNPALLRAVIHRESGGRACAVSAKGAQGLMQLMPATSAELGVSDAFDPAQNIGAGARYLKDLLKRYSGNLRLALAAYNAGPQRVDAGGAVPAIAETQAYVRAILETLDGESESPSFQ